MSGRADLGMIATQFARGGDNTRAADYSEKAAAAAEGVLAFDRAVQFYSMALALGEFDRARAGSLHQRLASAHASAGRGSDAAAEYLRAAELAESVHHASTLRRHAAEEWIRSGNVREGVRLLASVGAEFNIRHTDRVPLAVLSIVWHRARLALRGSGYVERPATGAPAKDLARLEVYRSLNCGTHSLESNNRHALPLEVSPPCAQAGPTSTPGTGARLRGHVRRHGRGACISSRSQSA